jgi:hypothetical protein
MTTYLEAIQLHPRGYPERLASDIANDPEAIGYIVEGLPGGSVDTAAVIAAIETAGELDIDVTGNAATADDATPDGALDDRITALEDAPGGSSPIIESDWVPFTDAEVKAWPTVLNSRRIIVPTPGAGKYFRFWGADIILDTTAGPYGGVDVLAHIEFMVGEKVVSMVAVEPTTTNMFEEEGVVKLSIPVLSPPETGAFSLSGFEDGPIYMQWANENTAFTGGNVLNSAKVKAWYAVVTF